LPSLPSLYPSFRPPHIHPIPLPHALPALTSLSVRRWMKIAFHFTFALFRHLTATTRPIPRFYLPIYIATNLLLPMPLSHLLPAPPLALLLPNFFLVPHPSPHPHPHPRCLFMPVCRQAPLALPVCAQCPARPPVPVPSLPLLRLPYPSPLLTPFVFIGRRPHRPPQGRREGAPREQEERRVCGTVLPRRGLVSFLESSLFCFIVYGFCFARHVESSRACMSACGASGGSRDQVSGEAGALGGGEVCWGAGGGDCKPRAGRCLCLCGAVGTDEGRTEEDGASSSRRRAEVEMRPARGTAASRSGHPRRRKGVGRNETTRACVKRLVRLAQKEGGARARRGDTEEPPELEESSGVDAVVAGGGAEERGV
jgi:hypothetical protein